MVQSFDVTETFEIDGKEFEVTFEVQASPEDGGVGSYEHFGFKGVDSFDSWDFNLLEITFVQEKETQEEVIPDNQLKRRLKAEINEWISEHSDELPNRLD